MMAQRLKLRQRARLFHAQKALVQMRPRKTRDQLSWWLDRQARNASPFLMRRCRIRAAKWAGLARKNA